MTRQTINIPPIAAVVYFGVLLTIGPLVTISKVKEAEKRLVISKETEVPKVHLTYSLAKPGMGGMFLNRAQDTVISISPKLIGDIQNEELWAPHKPFAGGSKEPYQYKLWDLLFPYELSKKANNDTIIAFRDGYEFRFLLEEPDNTPPEIHAFVKSVWKKLFGDKNNSPD